MQERMKRILFVSALLGLLAGCISHPHPGFAPGLLTPEAMDAIGSSGDFPWETLSRKELISFLGKPDSVEQDNSCNTSSDVLHYIREFHNDRSSGQSKRRIDFYFYFTGQRMTGSTWHELLRYSKAEYNEDNCPRTNPFLGLALSNVAYVVINYSLRGDGCSQSQESCSISLKNTNSNEIASLFNKAVQLQHCESLPDNVRPCIGGYSRYVTVDFYRRTPGYAPNVLSFEVIGTISFCGSMHSPPEIDRTVVILSEPEGYEDKKITAPCRELTVLGWELTRKYLPVKLKEISAVFAEGSQRDIQPTNSPYSSPAAGSKR